MQRIFGKKTVVDGITFDSEMEAKYYEQLKTMDIEDLRIHEKFVLQDDFRDPDNNLHKSITYSPDFIYLNKSDGRYYFIDVKGFFPEASRIIWKLFIKHIISLNLEKYKNAKFSIMKYSKTTGFVDLKDYKKAMATAKSKAILEKNNAVKETEQIKKDLLTIKTLRSKKTPLTKLQSEKLEALLVTYKDLI